MCVCVCVRLKGTFLCEFFSFYTVHKMTKSGSGDGVFVWVFVYELLDWYDHKISKSKRGDCFLHKLKYLMMKGFSHHLITSKIGLAVCVSFMRGR